MSLDGLPELQKRLGDTKFTQATKKGMTQAVIFFEGEAKKDTPVKSGQLRSSFTHQISADGKEGKVGTNKIYGPFVEYGTGIYAGRGRIYPKSKRALAWNGTVRKSIAGMKGRFFVKQAWEKEGGGKLLRFFKDEFDKALSE